MARVLRLHVSGGFYHVTLRGNHRQPIFLSPADRDLMDGIVARALVDLGARLHAYCWMTNHIHMLVQVGTEPLGKVMLRVGGQFTRKVQHRIETTGHLFERRYHALLVDADVYLLTLLRYIHFNPVRAGLAPDPGAYTWSSHQTYLGQRPRDWVTTDFALRLFARRRDVARARYCRFMATPCPDQWGSGSLKPNDEEGQILGGDEFVARVGRHPASFTAPKKLDDLFAECERKFGFPRNALGSPGRGRSLSTARAWLAREAVASRAATVSALARELNRSETAIRRLMQRHSIVGEDE
jgi:REP element-mobilizing transposase RayT